MIISESGYGIPRSRSGPMAYGISKPYGRETMSLIAKMNLVGIPVTEARSTLISNTIEGLKAAGIWNELDCFYMWAAHSRGAALIDWKNPDTRTAITSSNYSGDFVADQYFKGNGTFKINTNYNPGDGGNYHFSQFSSSFGHYTMEHKDEQKVDIGSTNAATAGCELLSTTAFVIQAQNSTSAGATVANTTNCGLISSRRYANKQWNLQRNGYVLSPVAGDPSTLALPVVNNTFYIFCRNQAGTFNTFSQKKHSYFFAGSGAFEHFTLHNIIDKYYLTPLAVTPTTRISFIGNSMTEVGKYVEEVMVDIGNYNLDINRRGLSGYTTPQLLADSYTSVFNKQKPFLLKEVFFFWELTNDFCTNGCNATTTYNNLVIYLTALKSYYPNSKVVVATCLPRNIASMTTPANRQNDANLTDVTTLNGMIRNNLVATGLCDALADVASDPTMGIYSGGVAGVGEKNLTYYQADAIHPTTPGYNLLADTYIYPAINAYL